MKVAISNIAWPFASEGVVADLMAEAGVRGVEIAPTTIWPRPLETEEERILEYRRRWERRGIRIVAMQALLFGRPDLKVFGSDAERRQTIDYLRGIFRVGGLLGAGPLVFGSPKNRLRGALGREEAFSAAVTFFREAAAHAVEHGVVLCIEPNPPEYGCDFVTTSREARELVSAVAHPGFGLHLDAGGITLAGEDPAAVVAASIAAVRHVHASEPHLAPLGEGGADHRTLAASLRRLGYADWVSVEMRHDASRDLSAELRRVLRLLVETYGG